MAEQEKSWRARLKRIGPWTVLALFAAGIVF